MSSEAQTAKIFWRDFFVLAVAGGCFLGVFSSLFQGLFTGTDLHIPVRYALFVAALGYVIFSTGFLFRKMKNLQAAPAKAANVVLKLYITVCALIFIIMSDVSPFIFAGKLSYQAFKGVAVTTLFYPLMPGNEKFPESDRRNLKGDDLAQ